MENDLDREMTRSEMTKLDTILKYTCVIDAMKYVTYLDNIMS